MNREIIHWNRVMAESFRVSVITHTNCRNVMDPGMHGCRADKVTQIQSQIRTLYENAQVFIIFGQFDRSRIT